MQRYLSAASLAVLAAFGTIANCAPLIEWLSPASRGADAEDAADCSPYNFALPPGVSPPPHPPGTCVTPARVALGRRLFYEEALSRNNNQSCASCHIQKLAFSDAKTRSRGSTGEIHPRNALSLANAGYFSTLTWFNPEVTRFDNQVLIPLFSESTPTTIEEMAISGMEWVVTRRLQQDRAEPSYPEMFVAAFPESGLAADSSPAEIGRIMHITNVARALAAFQTTMLSYRSAYDRGDATGHVASAGNAQSDDEVADSAKAGHSRDSAARRGRDLFFSARAGCADCHNGPNFNRDREGGALGYYNIGLYNVKAAGDYPDQQIHGAAAPRATQGLYLVSGDPADRGRFRTPSLRNVAVTGPYMHDGSVTTLAEAVAHFNAGGRNIVRGALAGDGRRNPNKDPRIRALGLSSAEQADLVAFLESLTDECFLNDPRLSDPDLPPPKSPAHCD